MIPRNRPSAHLAGYAAIGVSLMSVFAVRNLPSTTAAFAFLLQSDFGNALAALLAVGGYLLDHWNSRKSQQMEAQMARVMAQSHELLIPVTMQFHSLYLGATLQFVDKHLDKIPKLSPDESVDYTDDILKKYTSSPVMEMPTELNDPKSIALLITEIMMTERKSTLKTGVTAAMGAAPRITSPRELPLVLHKAIENCQKEGENKPTSILWKSYEAFIRHEFVPAVDRIAEIIDEHGHLMQPVSPKRLAEIFDRSGTGYGQTWPIVPRMWFYSMWLCYARSWKTLLAMWDQGIYQEIRPSMAFPIGIMFFNIEAQSIVAGMEKELVGMSQMHGHDINRQ
jgi:hypothetical protein